MANRRDFLKMLGASTAAFGLSAALPESEQYGQIILASEPIKEPEPGAFTVFGDERKVFNGERWVDPVSESRRPVSIMMPSNRPGGERWVIYPGFLRWRGTVYCHECYAAVLQAEGQNQAWWVRPIMAEAGTFCDQCGREMERWGNYPAGISKNAGGTTW